jgi:hypothetical protein
VTIRTELWSNHKKAGMALLTPDKTDFEIRNVSTGQETHLIIVRGSVYREAITMINI